MISVTIMNKNTPVLTADVTFSTRNKIPTPLFTNVSILNKELCPVCVFDEERATDQTQKWFDLRFFNKHKIADFDNSPIDVNTSQKLLHFASLADQYWIRYNESETWEDINFFRNKFNDKANSFFNSYVCSEPKYLKDLLVDWNTPDLCTNGVMVKCWRQKDGTQVLEKYSTRAHNIFKELLATKVLSKMNKKNFVRYELAIDNGMRCCVCKNFISEDQELVPAWQLIDTIPGNANAYEKLIKAGEKYNIKNIDRFLDELIQIDCLLCNYDRNQGNIGFIRDVNTGKFIGPAPIYDFSGAFQFPNNKTTTFFKEREKQLYEAGQISTIGVKPYEEYIIKSNLLSQEEKSTIINAITANQKAVSKKKAQYKKRPYDMNKMYE